MTSGGTLHCTFLKLSLRAGGYSINLTIEDAGQVLDGWTFATDMIVISVPPIQKKPPPYEIKVDLDEPASQDPHLLEPQVKASVRVEKT